MARDLTWVCDELAQLHADLEAIREHRAEAEAAHRQDGDRPAQPAEPRASDLDAK